MRPHLHLQGETATEAAMGQGGPSSLLLFGLAGSLSCGSALSREKLAKMKLT